MARQYRVWKRWVPKWLRSFLTTEFPQSLYIFPGKEKPHVP